MKELMVGITRAEGDKKNRNSQPWVSLGLKLGKGRSEYQGIEDEKEIEVKNFSSQLRVRAWVKEYLNIENDRKRLRRRILAADLNLAYRRNKK